MGWEIDPKEQIKVKFLELWQKLWLKEELIKQIREDLGVKDNNVAEPIKYEDNKPTQVEIKKELVMWCNPEWVQVSPMQKILEQKTAY